MSLRIWDYLNRAIDVYERNKTRLIMRIRAVRPKGVFKPKFMAGRDWEQLEYKGQYWFRTSKQWFWRKIKSPYVSSSSILRTFCDSDETDQRFLSHADNKYYSSKSAYRAELRARGYEEVGDQGHALRQMTEKKQAENNARARQQFRDKMMEVAHRL